MPTLDQIRTFVRRALKARRLGFTFMGTSHFRLPSAARLNGGLRPLSFPEDPALALDVIGVWLEDDYRLASVDAPVTTVLDVEANVGLFSLWAWRNFPNARIHAYEPNPAVLPHLQANLDGLPNVVVWPEGVSDHDGHANIETLDSSRLAQTRLNAKGEITLTAIGRAIERLDNKVDLLKLDCEGAEWSIFNSPEPLRHVREIRMEYHLTEGRTLQDLRQAAESIGFDITDLRPNSGFGIAFLVNRATV